jgi:tripartite-type tricarboxylate transporter receptor subunit TctC
VGAGGLPAAFAQSAGLGALSSGTVRPLRLIVPFAAGGPTDVMARGLAQVLSAKIGQPVLVENVPGAGGNIAAARVAASPPDGNTLLVAGQAIMAINKPLYGRLSYDPERDFSWVGLLGSVPNVLVAHPQAVPARTMAEFVELARRQTLSYGSNGQGSLSHLTTELMASLAGVRFLHVPYQGAAPQRTDLLAGRIGFTLVGPATALPLVRSGNLHALAVSTARRAAALPEVPTLVESGFPSLDAPVWFAAVAPAATPPATLGNLRQAFDAALSDPAYAAEMDRQLGQVEHIGVEAATALLARERKLWADAVRITGASAS